MVKWAGNAERMGRKKDEQKALEGNPKGKTPLEDLDVECWITLKRILEKQDGRL
jgi:hypothetical protein